MQRLFEGVFSGVWPPEFVLEQFELLFARIVEIKVHSYIAPLLASGSWMPVTRAFGCAPAFIL